MVSGEGSGIRLYRFLNIEFYSTFLYNTKLHTNNPSNGASSGRELEQNPEMNYYSAKSVKSEPMFY